MQGFSPRGKHRLHDRCLPQADEELIPLVISHVMDLATLPADVSLSAYAGGPRSTAQARRNRTHYDTTIVTSLIVTTWYHAPGGGPIMRVEESHDVGRLWLGQGLTGAGTQVATLALPLTAILLLHASAGVVGMLTALQWVPFLGLSLFVGIVVDRRRRQPLLILGNLVRAAALGGIVSLAYTGHLSVSLLLALVFVLGCGAVVFEVALPAYVPGLVGTGDLIGVNQRLQSAATGAQLGGPVAAGLLVQVLSAPLALGLNALGFVGSAWAFGTIRHAEVAPPRSGTRPWLELREGVRFTWSHRHLRSLIPVSASYNLFNQWLLTVYVIYAVRDLHLSPFLIGVTLAGGTVGAFLGAKASDALSQRFGLGASFLSVVIVECGAALLVPFVPRQSPWELPLLLGAFGLMDFGATLSGVIAMAVRQTVTPSALLGRMTAFYRTVSYGTIPLGAAAGGWVAEWLGVWPSLFIGAALLLTTIAWAASSPLTGVRSTLELPAPPSSS